MTTTDALREAAIAKLNYDPSTGVFMWKAPLNKALSHRPAGCLDSYGYRRIKICRGLVKAHRLAWLMTYGDMPSGVEIDHINGLRDDNRIANLRLADRSINTQNVSIRNNSTSGLMGASYYKPTGKWKAQITANRKKMFLGYFDTALSAHEAYMQAKRTLHQGYVDRGANHGITTQAKKEQA